jgi:hypothetical protein
VVGGSLGTLKKAIQLALGTDLETIKNDLADLKSEVRLIGVKQDEMDKRLNTKIDELDKRLTTRIDALSEKVDFKGTLRN